MSVPLPCRRRACGSPPSSPHRTPLLGRRTPLGARTLIHGTPLDRALLDRTLPGEGLLRTLLCGLPGCRLFLGSALPGRALLARRLFRRLLCGFRLGGAFLTRM